MILFEKAKIYADMIKLAHTLFALPFALSAVALAYICGYRLSPAKFLWILLAFTAARSAAMGFNRAADADIDALNPRTMSRPTVSGKISVGQTKFFTAASAAVFIFAAFMINPLCGALSIPALCALFGYSYTKRFTFLAHYALGFALALAPTGAWIAVTGSLDARIFLLGGCLFFAIAGFDLIYALQDMDFDAAHGLHSIPARFGRRKTLAVVAASFAAASAFLFATGAAFALNGAFFAVAGIIAALFAAGLGLFLKLGLKKVDIVFFHLNALISILILLAITTNLF